MNCSSCGNETPRGSQFCGACGERFESGSTSQADVRCPSCGNETPRGSQFCGVCGEPFNAVQVDPSYTDLVKCPSCGRETPGGFQFCDTCGKQLKAPLAAQSERPWYKNSALQIVLVIAVTGIGLSIAANVIAQPPTPAPTSTPIPTPTPTSGDSEPEIRGLSHFELCQKYGYADNRSKALENCTKFIDLNPDRTEWEIIEAYEIRGFTHAGLNHFEEAITEYEQALKLEPDLNVSSGIYGRLSNAYFDFGNHTYESDTDFALVQFERGIETISKILELNANYDLDYTIVGNAYKRLAEPTDDRDLFEKALKNFDKALKLNPGEEDASQGRIEVLRAMIKSTVPTKTYSHEMAGFSIDYDGDWEVVERIHQDAPEGVLPDVVFQSPLGTFVKIEIERIPNQTLQELAEHRIAGDRNFIENNRVAIGALPGYLSKGIDVESGNPRDILMIANDPWGIYVVFAPESDLVEVYQPIFLTMIESFRVFSPTTTKE